MGQQLSTTDEQTAESQAVSFQREKMRFAMSRPSFINSFDQPNTCMNQFCNFPSKKPEKWKNETIKRLKVIKAKYWPNILIRVLKQSDSQTVDTIYQADMYYLLNKPNISEISPIKDSSPSIKESFNHSRPDIKFSTMQIQMSVHPDSKGFGGSENRRSESIDVAHENKSRNSLAKKEERRSTINRSVDMQRFKSAQTESSFQPKDGRDTLKDSFSNHVIRIGKSSTKLQVPDKSFQPSIQKFSLRETELHFSNGNGCLDKFELTIGLLQKHLADPKNVFYKLIIAFENYFTERYANLQQKATEIRIDYEKMTTVATNDMRRFIEILYESTRLFYGFQKIKKQFIQEYDRIFSKENLMNSLTSIVFNQNIHNVLLELYRIKNLKIEQFCSRSFVTWKDLDPQAFGVHDKYALNEKTIECFEEKDTLLVESKSMTFGKNDSSPRQESKSEIRFEMHPDRLSEASIHAKMVARDSVPAETGTSIPYEKAIAEMSLLKNKITPVQKLKTLIGVAEMIHLSISTFYKNAGHVPEDSLEVDQMLPIFFYVIVKSGFCDIFTHSQIIENFIPKTSLSYAECAYLRIIEALGNFLYTKTLRNSYNFETVGANLQEFLRRSIIRVASSNNSRDTLAKNF